MPEQSGYELLDEILNDIADALREKIGGQTTEELVTNAGTLNTYILNPKTGFNLATTGACRTALTSKTHKCIMCYGYSIDTDDDLLFVLEQEGTDLSESDFTIYTAETVPSSISIYNKTSSSVTMHVYSVYWRGSTGTWRDEVGSGTTIAAGATYSYESAYLYNDSNIFSNTRIVTIPLGDIDAQDFSTLIRSIEGGA